MPFLAAPIVIIVLASLLILITLIRWLRLRETPIKARAAQASLTGSHASGKSIAFAFLESGWIPSLPYYSCVRTDSSHMSHAEQAVLQAQAGPHDYCARAKILFSFLFATIYIPSRLSADSVLRSRVVREQIRDHQVRLHRPDRVLHHGPHRVHCVLESGRRAGRFLYQLYRGVDGCAPSCIPLFLSFSYGAHFFTSHTRQEACWWCLAAW